MQFFKLNVGMRIFDRKVVYERWRSLKGQAKGIHRLVGWQPPPPAR